MLGFALMPLGCKKKDETTEARPAAKAQRYQCPMHPQVIKDQPGDCPICHMRLVPMEESAAPAPAAKRQVLFYRNPMNPKVTSPTPMKDPMGMDYVPVYSDEVQTTKMPGQSPVRITPAQQQLIGVRVSAVERRPLTGTIRASARVAYDPDLYNAILEHQQAVSSLPRAADNSTFQKEAQRTVQATRLRLQRMGLSASQIDRLGSSEDDLDGFLLPEAGGTVWVYADIYAYEAPRIKSGQSVELTSTALPGRTFMGKVRSIDTVINAETRTLRARIEVPKAGGDLKPEMFLNAAIETSGEKALAVPKSAILPTGTRQLAFVETEPGKYEPREVRLGRETDDYFEVLGGLAEGERVVTSANFFIDSESKLKAAAERGN
jgi:membrane fusion protein, copper/silver efflux system